MIKIFDPMPPPYPLGWIPNATFVQPDAEQALRDKLAGYRDADVFLSTDRRVADAGSNIGVADGAARRSASEFEIRARYLVGCDGANSFVRKQLGTGLEDLAFDEWWMVVDTLTSDPAKRPAKSFQYCWPSRPGTFVPGPGNLRRWEIKLLPGEDPEAAGTPDNVLKLLEGFTDTSDLTIWRSAVYRFHALLGQGWRDRRVLLMGDAVHQTPPFLGQGLCAGIRDAANLAWKLALVMRGDAGDALLDSYEIERKPHVRSVVASAKEFGKIIGELDPAAAAARDARLRAELKSGKAETIRQKFIPDLAGGLIARARNWPAGCSCSRMCARRRPLEAPRRSAQAGIRAGSPRRRRRWTWLSEASRAAGNGSAGAQVVIAASGESARHDGVLTITEADGLFADWMRHNAVEAVIVRPDRYVFGGGRKMQSELNMLIGQLLQNLRAGRQAFQTAALSVPPVEETPQEDQ